MLKKGIKVWLSVLLCLACANVFAQSDTSTYFSASSVVLQQADSMGYYYKNNDFNNFMKYQHPGLVKLLGGEESLMKTLNDNVKKGIITLSITNDAPSKIIASDSNMQCTIQQTNVMKIGSTKLEYISTLVCISYDNGKKWFFLNASGTPLTAIKQVLPELSSELIIQEQQTRAIK
ncbi:MAG TPA: hypothetical protein PKN48_06630 [Bacteroidales bacterium]|nr:hypothetical protein [Bacteroidales bacterium]